MKTSKDLRKLAVDANVILSAVAGKAALKVFLIEGIEFVTTQFNIVEAREYLSIFANKYHFHIEILESQLKLLPVKIYLKTFYEDYLQKASQMLFDRDVDDIELLALAMKLKTPIWSNDKDFEHSGIEVYNTTKLLKMLLSWIEKWDK